jgi:acetyltransferase-like isoleucine patch superfamily enzyme
MSYIIQKSIFRLKAVFISGFSSFCRKIYYRLSGMSIGKGSIIPRISATWPHQVSIGANCVLEAGINFKYDGIWEEGPAIKIADNVFLGANCEFNINSGISIDAFSNIASGCKFIDHDHGFALGARIGIQPSAKAQIVIKDDVWLGVNVVILKGVSIGSGSIVAAGAVVTKSIPDNQIWGGVPAKFIKNRI